MEIYNYNPKIYLIAGLARSGKDTVKDIIMEFCNEKNIKSIAIQFAFYIKHYAKMISDWDGNEKNKPRELLQFLGTEFIRNKIDDNFFINRVCEDVMVYSNFFDVIIINDARLKKEITELKGKFNSVKTIHVKRPNFLNDLTKEQSHHRTETELENYNDYDFVVENAGTIEDLKLKIYNLIEKDLI